MFILLCIPIILVLVILLLYFYYYQQCFKYWQRKGLPTAKPKFPFGNLGISALGKQSVYTRLANLYNEFKAKGYKHAGIYFFNGPIYFPIDPNLIKRILQTDFDYFIDRGMYGDSQKLPLSGHIFSMEGNAWKNIRSKMSPSFTSGKLKNMYPIIVKSCTNLIDTIDNRLVIDKQIELKDVLLKFAADVIGSTSFGIDCNTLNNPDSEFVKIVERISHHSSWKLIRIAFEEGLQNPGNIEKIAYSDKVIETFFTKLVRDTIDYRDRNKIVRPDFLNMLMELRGEITIQEIVAQCYLFFIAGFKTSAFTMCYCLHELAQNQNVQEEIRAEIFENVGTDFKKYEHDELVRLKLLDFALKETMRKYPPLPMLNRICVKDYQVPGSDLVLEKGTPVIISLMGLQRDAEFFPQPLQFKPDRFNAHNSIVPFTYLPFGDGPRNCIGLRFGMVKTKLAVASLISRFRFLPIKKTKELEIDASTTSILYNVQGGVYVKIEKL